MRKQLIIFIGCLMIIGGIARAQQQPMFTQYMFNASAINPGVIGTHGTLSMTALIREQWVGLEGAPNTQTFSMHSPLLNDRVGLGLTLLRDEIGITKQHTVFAGYAYRVHFGAATLSMGVSGGFMNFKSDPSELNPNNPDQSLEDDYVDGFKPNFGAGAYLYADRFYVGLSAPLLLNHDFINDNENNDERQQRKHYFLMAGYVFELNSMLKLKPNFLLKAVDGAPLEVDLNANLLFQEVLWLGVSYRSFDSIDALIELQLNPSVRLGYAHDFTVSELRHANRGSHELMVNYRFQFKNKKTITPRYF